jgi:hypothetical protein
MVALRIVALCSNIAFISYADALHLLPILILHGALIPINLRRLACAWRDKQTRSGDSAVESLIVTSNASGCGVTRAGPASGTQHPLAMLVSPSIICWFRRFGGTPR